MKSVKNGSGMIMHIPAEVIRELNIEVGTEFEYAVVNEILLIRKYIHKTEE